MKKDKKYLLALVIFTLIIIVYSVYILMNNFNTSKAELIGFIAIYVAYIIFISGPIKNRFKKEILATKDGEQEEVN